MRVVVVALASTLAKTEKLGGVSGWDNFREGRAGWEIGYFGWEEYTYPSSRRDSARNAVQTSVTIPPIMNCFFPVARTAARNSGLSHAL